MRRLDGLRPEATQVTVALVIDEDDNEVGRGGPRAAKGNKQDHKYREEKAFTFHAHSMQSLDTYVKYTHQGDANRRPPLPLPGHPGSGDNVMENISIYIREPNIPAVVLKGKALVIQAEQMQDGRMEIVIGNRVFLREHA